MTSSMQVFASTSAATNAKHVLNNGCSPARAKLLLAQCQAAFEKDVEQFGEAAVKGSSFYPQLVAVAKELEAAAAQAVSRASGVQRM